jgi:large subunit ribosomal protein L29
LKIAEVRALGTEELKKQLEDAHRELFDLRFKLSTRQLVNHREIPRVKRKIAVINTLLTERELNIR